jgi:hypothetical protein
MISHLARQKLSELHNIALSGVGASLSLCGLWRTFQGILSWFDDPDQLRKLVKTNARIDGGLMIVHVIAMVVLLVLSLEVGVRQILMKRPVGKKRTVYAKTLGACTVALQLTIIALLVVFLRQAMLLNQPWAGRIWLRPWWSMTMDGLMVLVPCSLATSLDVAISKSRLPRPEPEMAMQEPQTTIQEPVTLAVAEISPPPYARVTPP